MTGVSSVGDGLEMTKVWIIPEKVDESMPCRKASWSVDWFMMLIPKPWLTVCSIGATSQAISKLLKYLRNSFSDRLELAEDPLAFDGI